MGKQDPNATDPTEPIEEPGTDPAPDPEPPAADPEPAPDPEPADKHGKPGVNREKYQRDIEARDARIAELEAQVAEAAKTEEGRAELQRQVDALKAEADSAKTDLELERAGCADPKKAAAARALLSGFGGDVAKLKAEHPYLFEEKGPSGTAGGKPGGAPEPGGDEDDALDRAFGLKK